MVVLDSLEFGHTEAVLDAPVEVGDIDDRALVTRVVEQYNVDAVVHFAGYKAAGESMEMPARYFDNNVARSSVLFDTLQSTGVTRVVFSSSCSVYGTPTVLPVDESHPTGPESPYAESKLLVERMLRWFDECHGLRSVSLRYFNAAGASFDARIGEDSPKPLNLVPLAMLAALGKIPQLSVYGTDYDTPDGSCIRDYIHVDDLADAHVRALDHLADGGDTTARQCGHRRRLVGARGDRRCEAGERHRLPRTGRRATRRRPVSGVGRQHPCGRGARMERHARARRNPRERVGLALLAPRRLRHATLKRQWAWTSRENS